MTSGPPMPPEVIRAFDVLPDDIRPALDRLRALIFATAAAEGAGPVEEALRWGQPAYIAPKGSTIRLGQAKSGEAALFVNCRTSLIEDFRTIAPAGSRFEGTRAVLFGPREEIDEAALAILVARALTWHVKGKRRR
jgi:hypothetical protein